MESLPFIISLSLLKKNLDMLHCIVLLFTGQNMTNVVVVDFTIHFHFSNIFPDFSRVLNLWMSVFRGISRGLIFADGKFCDI